MLRLRALQIGAAAPSVSSGRCCGRVRDVYASGFHHEWAHGLMYVGVGDRGVCPFGVVLEAEAIRKALPLLQPGQLAVLKPGSVMIYAAEPMLLDLAHSTPAPSGLPAIRNPDYRAVAAWCGSYLAAHDRADKSFGQTERADHRDLFSAVRRRNTGEAVRLLLKIIGRGPGLTPSGDDWIVGCISALASDPCGGFLRHALGLALPNASTTHVGKAYLTAALSGAYHSFVTRFWRDAADGDLTSLSHSADLLAGLGHTSGLDTLSGMYEGLFYLSEE